MTRVGGALVALTFTLSGLAVAVPLPANAASAVHVNFQPASAPVPSGYVADTGAAFNGTSGWQSLTGSALDLTANTRDRNSSASPDQRYDTFIHIQAPSGTGTTTPGRWQYALPSGQYDVTVAAGDALATNSVHEITAEAGTANAVTLIDHFAPTSSQLWSTVTKRVTVSDGFLTLDPTGGTNTKLDFVDIIPVTSGTAPKLDVSAPRDGILGLARSRLVFSTVKSAATPAQAFTFQNTGTGTLNVSNIAVGGTDSLSFGLASGQPTSLSIPAGQSATVKVVFTPTATANCPTSTNITIGAASRAATLTFKTNDPTQASSSVDLAGINSCGNEGANEPVLDQIATALGYTTVTSSFSDYRRRAIGPLRPLPNSDEVQVPYFRAANTSAPVTVTPVAHYSARTTAPFGRSGWFVQNSGVVTPCNSTCKQLFLFPADNAAPGTYVQNQKLFPTVTGSTTFSTSGVFGLYNGDANQVTYSDDAKNLAQTASGANISPPIYGHSFRAFPAYGPGHVLIPNTWLVGIDQARSPYYRSNDFNDVVLLVNNAQPAVGVASAPGTSALQHNLTTGGTVSSSCAVTGFSGVMPNTAGNQCNAANIHFTSSGLALTSTAGEMGGSTNSQQNALYDNFDASRGSFTVTTRVVGPITSLQNNYQQIGAFFGPDQDNYVKVEAEHNSLGTDPHLTMFYEEGGVGGSVASVSSTALTTATTLDLIIKGNTSQPDATPTASDTNHQRGWPLDRVTAYYSINGGTPVQIGTFRAPADVMRWFSTTARAGILASGGGSTTPLTATFRSFGITTP
jgi:hypothetical protein